MMTGISMPLLAATANDVEFIVTSLENSKIYREILFTAPSRKIIYTYYRSLRREISLFGNDR